MEKIKQIIWDWNGTLLNDVSMCVNVMNVLLKKYSLPSLSCDKYKQLFDFPVKDYYERLGFRFDVIAFEKVGHEFMDSYFKELPNCDIFPEVIQILEEFNALNMNQLVLSAMEHNALEKSLTEKGIRSFFSKVQGIDNHLANGKTELAKDLLKSSGFLAEESLFIGDTIHDLHVAQSIGCTCVLISNGHFSKDRLVKDHDLVFDSLSDFISYFKKISKL
ncbi:MAG: HAD family hydrolase [Bacteroidales bacterium]|jgi:phosphoglycolate phosphatase|nr:HAD family hydrolase [Bacteroidales bacterium]